MLRQEKQSAVTLIHKGAMEIGVHAVASFRRHFAGTYRLDVHSDGSLGEEDKATLRNAAAGIDIRMVDPADRQSVLESRLADFPRIRELLNGSGYFAKLEIPMSAPAPYFYFDSDIVWLRPVANLVPSAAPNAFSTESWSWYNGVAKDRLWIDAKTPRRVNSGFYYLGQPFPFERMEEMLERGMFDPTLRYNTDQEIMAYLFKDMELYHPDDLKRSRVRVRYDLATDRAAALHFPGGMWREHLDQMEALDRRPATAAIPIRYQAPVPLSRAELWRMRLAVRVSDAPLLRKGINRLRDLRRCFLQS